MFDWILAGVLAVLSVILLIGKGDAILRVINGKRKVSKHRTEGEKITYSRAMGVFVGILALDEVMVAMFPKNQYIMFMSVLIAIAAIVGMGNYAKKFK